VKRRRILLSLALLSSCVWCLGQVRQIYTAQQNFECPPRTTGQLVATGNDIPRPINTMQ